MRQEHQLGRRDGRQLRQVCGQRGQRFLDDHRRGDRSRRRLQREEEIVQRDFEAGHGRGLGLLDRLEHLFEQAIDVVEALATTIVAGEQAVELRFQVIDHHEHRRAGFVRDAAALRRLEGFVEQLCQFAELSRCG